MVLPITPLGKVGAYEGLLAIEARGVQGKHDRISAWTFCFRGHTKQRVIYHELQFHDRQGPKLAPDFSNGEDAGCWPQDVLVEDYNKHFASSDSVRSGGPHFAAGCHHFSLQPSCWLIKPYENPFLDIMINVAPVELCMKKECGDDPPS